MKRASIKGQGTDIFFGDTEGGVPTTNDVVSVAEDQTSVGLDVSTSASPDVPTSGRPDNRTGRRSDVQMSATEDERLATSWHIPAAMRRRLRAVLRDERRIHTTVRFSPEEMLALRDLVYQLEAKMGIKITRNEVMRIALHFFLEDYELRKKESLLLQVLEEIDD